MDQQFGLGSSGQFCLSGLGPFMQPQSSDKEGTEWSPWASPIRVSADAASRLPLDPRGLLTSGRLTQASSHTPVFQRAGVQAARLLPHSAAQSKSLWGPPVKGEGTKPRERWQGKAAI